jgi:hypothetical protein
VLVQTGSSEYPRPASIVGTTKQCPAPSQKIHPQIRPLVNAARPNKENPMSDQTKIGFNPEDRFMMTVANTLVVVRNDGSVFGSDVVNGQAQAVFEFGGGRIGFNPQDRFMTAVGNTLVVVTQDGSVFGSVVVNRQLQPVFQFSGARIGFNPQDRFMMAVGNTLVVVTEDGSVWGSEVKITPTNEFTGINADGTPAGRVIKREVLPVFQFSGAKIGFNPQDRFMMAVGNTLVVVTEDGSVWGSEVKITPTNEFTGINADGTPAGRVIKRELLPVFQFSGAKIGFNPQDRFMMALGTALVVVTGDGDAYGAETAGRSVSGVIQLNPAPLPAQLQFRLRYFIEHDSTDDLLQGANDEIYMSAIGTDSAAVLIGADGEPAASTMTAASIGDVSADPVRDRWRQEPYVLMDFDLHRPSDWPRSFVVTLLIVEQDNQDLAETLTKLEQEVGQTVKNAAEAAATAAAGALVGAAIGSVIPGAGTAVGAAVGALAGAAYDVIIKAIKDGLGNDVFTPVPVQLIVDDPNLIRQHPGIGGSHTVDIHEMGAWYTIEYDWFLVE